MKTLTEKHFLIIFCTLFFLSSVFLFWQNSRALDPNQGKNWWTLSFAHPEDTNSLAFTVDNHTNQSDFSYEAEYEVTPDTVITTEGSLVVAPGGTATMTPDITVQPPFRTTVTVTIGKEKKKIYR